MRKLRKTLWNQGRRSRHTSRETASGDILLIQVLHRILVGVQEL